MRVFDHLVVAHFLGPPCIAFAANLPREPSTRQNEARSAYMHTTIRRCNHVYTNSLQCFRVQWKAQERRLVRRRRRHCPLPNSLQLEMLLWADAAARKSISTRRAHAPPDDVISQFRRNTPQRCNYCRINVSNDVWFPVLIVVCMHTWPTLQHSSCVHLF